MKKYVELEILGYKYDHSSSINGRRFYLKYKGVSNFTTTSQPDKGLAGPYGYRDLGYDEIELISEALFEHRMIFSSGIELSVVFTEFELDYTDEGLDYFRLVPIIVNYVVSYREYGSF